MEHRVIAIEIREPGGPDVLTATERPRPIAAEGEVLIKVAAAGVNRPDVMQRQGRYPAPPGASDIPGLEVAGVVEDVGPSVAGLAIGDSVCALVSGGGYAEYVNAPAAQCLPVPRGLSVLEAAAIPETAFTVWTNVFERGRLRPGETLLVHGGSSGIGTTAIQLARARGARVFATAGSPEKCAACEALGAERAFNYREVDFVAQLREATGGRGADVVLDIVGGDYFQRNLDVLTMEGRLVLVGQLGGHEVADQHHADLRQAADDHGVDAPRAVGCRKRRDRQGRARARVAALRVRRHAGAGSRHVPAARCRRGAPPDGEQRSRRQDPVDHLTTEREAAVTET